MPTVALPVTSRPSQAASHTKHRPLQQAELHIKMNVTNRSRLLYQAVTMTPEETTLAFSDAQLEFTPIVRKPSENDTIAINKILTPLLLEILYNEDEDAERPHTLWGIIATKDNYATVHGSKFVLPPAIKSYDPSITEDTVKAERLQKTTK